MKIPLTAAERVISDFRGIHQNVRLARLRPEEKSTGDVADLRFQLFFFFFAHKIFQKEDPERAGRKEKQGGFVLILTQKGPVRLMSAPTCDNQAGDRMILCKFWPRLKMVFNVKQRRQTDGLRTSSFCRCLGNSAAAERLRSLQTGFFCSTVDSFSAFKRLLPTCSTGWSLSNNTEGR